MIVVDGNCKALKKPFSDVIADELLNRSSSEIVGDQIQALGGEGYKPQVKGRDINLFYSKDRLRKRILVTEMGFDVDETDISFSQEEILKELDEHPERFSPNVILRPLHQQMILPNIAYVGGGSEVAYWLQLLPLFEKHNIHFPMLVPRTSVQWIPLPFLKKSTNLELSLKTYSNM